MALTDHFVHERYTGDQYQEKLEILNGEVNAIYLVVASATASPHVYEILCSALSLFECFR